MRRPRMELPPELEKWEDLIARTVRRAKNDNRFKDTIGEEEDAVQIACEAIIKASSEGRVPSGEPDATKYLFGCIVNTFRKAFLNSPLIRLPDRRERRQKVAQKQRRPVVLDHLIDYYTYCENNDDPGHQQLCWLEGLVEQLPPRMSLIIKHLYGLCGRPQMSAANIAGLMGVTPGCISQRNYEAKKILRKMISERS